MKIVMFMKSFKMQLSFRLMFCGMFLSLYPVVLSANGTKDIESDILRENTRGQFQKPTKITFDEENTMYVDGRPLIPVFLWHGGTAQASVKGESITRRNICGSDKYWNRFNPVPYSFIRVNPKESDWKEIVESHVPLLKLHPSTLAYFLCHEPKFEDEPPSLINQVASLLERLDPDHPSFVHIGGNNPMRIRSYGEVAKIISISGMGISPGLMALNMNRTRLVIKDKKAIWPCMHPFSTNYDTYSADPLTLKSCVYSALINGAKGLSLYAPDHYFEWYMEYRPKNPKPKDKQIIAAYESLDELLAEVRYLTPIIASATPAQDYYSVDGDDGGLTTLMKAVGGELFLITANYTERKFTATFDISSITRGAHFEVRAPLEKKAPWFGRIVDSEPSKGTFTDNYNPFEVHLYRITSRANINKIRPTDADFNLPVETAAKRLARLQKVFDNISPNVISNPRYEIDPLYWEEKNGVRYVTLKAKDYYDPIRLKKMVINKIFSPVSFEENKGFYHQNASKFLLLADAKTRLEIEIEDGNRDKTCPVGVMLLDPQGKTVLKKYIKYNDENSLITLRPETHSSGTYTLVVKGNKYRVNIKNAPWVIDARSVMSYVGNGGVFYFHVPANVKKFSVTGATRKVTSKGKNEGNSFEIIDSLGNVRGKDTAFYKSRMLPLEEGGGERLDWIPLLNDPGPAKVTVIQSNAESKKPSLYALKFGPAPAEDGVVYSPYYFFRIDVPGGGFLSNNSREIAVPVE